MVGGLGLLQTMPQEMQDAMLPGVLELRLAIALELLTLVSERGNKTDFDCLFEDRDDVRDSYAVLVDVLRQRRVAEVTDVLREKLKARDRLTLETLARRKTEKGSK